ncbi:fumarate reductase (quinol) flavoprotein subunit [Oceanimonas sp. CHS3-5]|uniref:fumarate reductase (quinol) flavoprotein subunit n=1 Tax=Oceanimonas sp. CHS3-5 TaxID=3068186 RepID=UPI00273FEFB6|nr:fumarate reductase (quinol) flavoprotein subunit [Oceanimonas sp. CHS3-5]MDP5292543.1 fumarate reductase (quinol) flavoprotein subunit [Oceanimonas sp. CHS3-5]
MRTLNLDVAIIGAGGAGLRAAIAAAEADPALNIGLLSKVYPMRSHTVAAEGGAAAVIRDDDSLQQHFDDTVSGGDWLCEQDVVEFFVERCPEEMIRMEHWGCPWSRRPDGGINVRRFGGMKVERTWFAADKTGFHMLHTLFQTSIKYSQIQRFDEFFVLDLLVEQGQVRGLVALHLAEGEPVLIRANAVVLATGGAARVFRYNTNGGIVTGDGMAMAYRHGVALRDMEFVQYHPTGLPGSGILMTEGCRGEGGVLLNRHGYRYLQDYGLGPETPLGEPKNKHMELGPRDRVSQAFWHEQQQGNTISHPLGEVVHLDLRHLGEQKIKERLPFIRELAKAYVNVDPVREPIPIRPTAHYTMGGIEVDKHSHTAIRGLFAAGECASSGIHGANRLGSNSLAELLVFGRQAGEGAAKLAADKGGGDEAALLAQAREVVAGLDALRGRRGEERLADIRNELGRVMEDGCGIYRDEAGMQTTVNKVAELKARYQHINLTDTSRVFNTELVSAVELGFCLDVAEAMAHSAWQRKESRGAHQRLDEDCRERNDERFLRHSRAVYRPKQAPRIDYSQVTITKSPPATRVYGAAAEQETAQ